GSVIVESCFNPGNPRSLRKIWDVADNVAPGLAAVARELDVSVIGSYPDCLTVTRGLTDRINRGVHLRIRVVHRDATGLLLLLLLGIVGGEVRRDAVPGLTVVARPEKELCADVNRALLVLAHVDRSVPVEAQLPFSVVLLGLDAAALEREPVYTGDVTALGFGVNVTGISRVREDPEAISSKEV